MSFSSESKESAELFTMPRNSRCSWLSLVSSAKSVIPIMPFIGVRISWLIFARNSLLARLDVSPRPWPAASLPPRVSGPKYPDRYRGCLPFPLTISRTVWSSTSRCLIFPLAPCDHVDDFPIKRATRNLPISRKASLRRLLIHRSLFPRLPAVCIETTSQTPDCTALRSVGNPGPKSRRGTILDQSVKIGGSLCHALFQPVTRLL